jgi:hypothetical protein
MDNSLAPPVKRNNNQPPKRDTPPELFQVVIECRDEAQQRELFERFRREGLRVRLLVL